MKKKALFLDLDDTILDFAKTEDHAIEQMYRHFCHDVCSKKNFEAAFLHINLSLWEQVNKGFLSPSFVKIERFSRLIEHFSLTYESQKMALFYETVLSDKIFWLKDAQKTLHLLKHSHQLVIITNGLTRVQKRRLKKSKIDQLAHLHLIAEEVGIAKPHKQIFDIALNTLQLHADDVIMVGDCLYADYQGAKNSNMDFCWINPLNKIFPSDLSPPRLIIPSLSHLPNYL